MMEFHLRSALFATLLAWTLASCGGGNLEPGDGGGDGDGDADSDADSDADTDSNVDGDADDGGVDCPSGTVDCDDACCSLGEACRYDTCVPDPAPCVTDDDCSDDSWCDDGECTPYGLGPRGDFNDDCLLTIEPGLFSPALQCAWEGPAEGDPIPDYIRVLSTPVVAVLEDSPDDLRPSIIFNAAGPGVGTCSMYVGAIRIIDGRTCEQIDVIEEEEARTEGSTGPAVGDLDGDGIPEIVVMAQGGGLLAMERGEDGWRVRWRSTEADGVTPSTLWGDHSACVWSSPALADLDDDGRPEVIFEGVAHDADGRRIGSSVPYPYYYRGLLSVVADVDLDGQPELLTGAMTYRFEPGTGFVPEDYFAGSPTNGNVAVADFGDFPGAVGDDPGRPEIVVIATSTARVQTVAGEAVFGPYPIPGEGTGGPPTIGDFDGDGRPEFAVAGRGVYTVFDLDCVGGGPGCRGDGILWQIDTQDISSGVTGSSIFDFEGDGIAEVVYADECFVRVYSGPTGEVIFSGWRPSGTWLENPIVADVDGDFRAEMVVPTNASGEHCPDVDPVHPGIRCDEPGDCPSGACNGGLCRCESDEHCPEDYGCRPSLDGSPEQTCRAVNLGSSVGIRVYRDARDAWVGSRPVWNQHAYAVTNVTDEATIPRTSEVVNNWQVPELNNFRQNVQGDLAREGTPDLTSDGGSASCNSDGVVELRFRVCNRGAALVGTGIEVTAHADSITEGDELCTVTTSRVLGPGECEDLACTWDGPPDEEPVDVYLFADSDGRRSECFEENNTAVIPSVTGCGGPG